MSKHSFKEKMRVSHPALFRLAKRLLRLNIPAARWIYLPLRYERKLRHFVWERVAAMLYYEPMFKTACVSCGQNIRLEKGIPQIFGEPVIRIGDNATLSGTTTFCAAKTHPAPTLEIGSNAHLGYQLTVLIGNRVEIGRHVLIADRVHIFGHDAHPKDPFERAANEPPDESGAGEVIIEDYAWVGSGCHILKNVTVGRGAIVGAGSVVTKDVPPLTVAAGNPARVVGRVDGRQRVTRADEHGAMVGDAS